MGDQDWLENGHGAGDGLQPLIKGSSPRAFDRVSIRSVLRGTDAPKPRHSRRNKALVGWLLYCATAVGGTAAAFTVRDTLFPSLGAPTDNRVWPNPDTTLTTEHGSSSKANTDTTVTPTSLASSLAAAAPTAEATVPTVAGASQDPGDSIDNSGPGPAGPGARAGTGPAPGTTVDENQTTGQGPGPGTTVADNPTDTSTPSSASTPPTSPTATPTSPSTPVGGDTSGRQSGKGDGSGGGGGGGDGGGGSPTP